MFFNFCSFFSSVGVTLVTNLFSLLLIDRKIMVQVHHLDRWNLPWEMPRKTTQNWNHAQRYLVIFRCSAQNGKASQTNVIGLSDTGEVWCGVMSFPLYWNYDYTFIVFFLYFFNMWSQLLEKNINIFRKKCGIYLWNWLRNHIF